MLYTTHPSPLGELLFAGPEAGALAFITVPGQKGGPTVQPDWRRDDSAFGAAMEQMDAYFAGDLKEFDLTLATCGTDFRERVWAALDEIPYGSTVTYSGLTAMAGFGPRSVRAVGGAVGSNPLTVVHPCHRVIGVNGSLTGYAGGLHRKRQLLTLEGVLGQQEQLEL